MSKTIDLEEMTKIEGHATLRAACLQRHGGAL